MNCTLDEIVGKWCEANDLLRHDSVLTEEGEGCWVLFDDFGCQDYVSDVFPEHWESFSQFLKSHGFFIEQKAPDCLSITLYGDA